jgi:hypothetical protein
LFFETKKPLRDLNGVISFQHPKKISFLLIRNTVAPTAIRAALGSYSAIEDVKSPKAELDMSIIPLDIQRRCERRWAARFSPPAKTVGSRNPRPKRESQQIAGVDKSGTKSAKRLGVDRKVSG